MYRGTTNSLAKIWNSVGGQQITSVPSGTTVTGDAPGANGYTYLRTPQAGFTKTMWLSNYNVVTAPPPPPPPPPPDGQPTLTHEIDIFSDGSITIDGNPYP